MFFIDGITNPSFIQPNVSNVRAAYVDGLEQVRSLFVDGPFPAIVSSPQNNRLHRGPKSRFQVCPPGDFPDSGQCVACSKGMYCPFSPLFEERPQLPCPVQTFNPRRGSANISDCRVCPAGSHCSLTGQSVPNECSAFPGTRKYCSVKRRKVCSADSATSAATCSYTSDIACECT